MSRSSSSSLGSSLMPLNSLRAVGAHRMRMVDGAVDHLRASTLMLIDTGAVALHGEQVVVDGRVHALRGLGGADRPAEVAHAPSSAQELEAAAEAASASRRFPAGRDARRRRARAAAGGPGAPRDRRAAASPAL